MINLCQWRIRIGVWSNRTYQRNRSSNRGSNTNNDSALAVLLKSCVLVFLYSLLILSGDVELNPGPLQPNVEAVFKEVLRKNYDSLSTAVQPCLKGVATEMFVLKLISSIEDTPNFDSLIIQFQTQALESSSIEELEKVCQQFVSILSRQGGAVQVAALSLAEQWKNEIHEKCIAINKDATNRFSEAVRDTYQPTCTAAEMSLTSYTIVQDCGSTCEIKGKPEMEQLLEFLDPLVYWQRFGLHLPAITDDVIHKIEIDEKTVSNRKRTLYSNWLRLCPTASWNDVIIALKKAKENNLVENIQKLLKGQSTSTLHDTVDIYLPFNSSDEEEFQQTLEGLHYDFTILVNNFTKAVEKKISERKESLIDIIGFVQDFTIARIDGLETSQTFGEVMKRIDSLYDFLNCKALIQIAKRLQLSKQFEDHSIEAREFRKSRSVKKLRKCLERIKIYTISSDSNATNGPVACLHLNTVWDKMSIDGFYVLLNCFFPNCDRQSLIKHIKITCASVHVRYHITESQSQICQAILYAKKKVPLMSYIGIYGFEIDGHNILPSKDKDEQYTFGSGLLNAAKDGSDEAVQFLHDVGINVNYSDDNGITPLMLATAHSHTPVVETLLSAGANVNAKCKSGWTALMLASQKGLVQIVQLLNGKLHDDDSGYSNSVSPCDSFDEIPSLFFDDIPPQDNMIMLARMKQLYSAIINNDMFQIIQLVKHQEVDINVKFQPNACPLGNSETLLHLAVETGRLSIVNVMLNLGANVNITNKDGKRALRYALQYSYHDIARTLIDHGAKCENEYLHYLVEHQMTEYIDECLSSGVFDQIDIIDKFGNTPLHLAIIHVNDCNDIVDVLLKHGANTGIQNMSGLTPLYLAALDGNIVAMEKLMEYGADIYFVNEHEQNYLHIAVINNDFTAVESFLIFFKDQLDSMDECFKTPLHISAENGFNAIAELLLSNGCNPNLLDIFDNAPLHYAGEGGHSCLVENLIKYEAIVDILNQDGMTPLSLAAGSNYLDIVKMLLSHKANINSVDNSGWSPLHHAAWNGCYEIVVELTSKGADINIEDENGMGALRHAVGKGHADVTRTLMENGANVNVMDDGEWSLLHEAAHKNHVDVAHVLLEKGFNVDIQDDDKWSAFNEALIHAYADVVCLMLEFGANTTYREEHDGKTSIHHAVDSRHKPDRYKVIEILLECPEVDPNATDDFGKTPLHYAVQRNFPDIVQLLLDHGADINIQDEVGDTPFELASLNQREEIMKVFNI